MSDIQRFGIWGCAELVVTPVDGGPWIRYDDHVDEVERLTIELDEAQAGVLQLTHQNIEKFDEIKRLKNAIDHLTSERDAAQAEVKRLTVERDEALAERDGARRVRERLQDLLTCERQELSTLRDRLRVLQTNPSASLTSSRSTDEDIRSESLMRQLHYWWQEAVKLREDLDEAQVEVERLTIERDEARPSVERLMNELGGDFGEIERLKNAIDHVTSERDEAQVEVERLTAERDTAQANVKWLIDRGNGKASLNRLRATDEDIWREAFMRHLFNADDGMAAEYTDHDVEKLMDATDLALALYRKRWPR